MWRKRFGHLLQHHCCALGGSGAHVCLVRALAASGAATRFLSTMVVALNVRLLARPKHTDAMTFGPKAIGRGPAHVLRSDVPLWFEAFLANKRSVWVAPTPHDEYLQLPPTTRN